MYTVESNHQFEGRFANLLFPKRSSWRNLSRPPTMIRQMKLYCTSFNFVDSSATVLLKKDPLNYKHAIACESFNFIRENTSSIISRWNGQMQFDRYRSLPSRHVFASVNHATRIGLCSACKPNSVSNECNGVSFDPWFTIGGDSSEHAVTLVGLHMQVGSVSPQTISENRKILHDRWLSRRTNNKRRASLTNISRRIRFRRRVQTELEFRPSIEFDIDQTRNSISSEHWFERCTKREYTL